MKTYIVIRLARYNPSIRDLRLYLSATGLWSLDVENARHFDKRSDATKAKGPARLGAWVQEAPPTFPALDPRDEPSEFSDLRQCGDD
jgi:hypothetical protein